MSAAAAVGLVVLVPLAVGALLSPPPRPPAVDAPRSPRSRRAGAAAVLVGAVGVVLVAPGLLPLALIGPLAFAGALRLVAARRRDRAAAATRHRVVDLCEVLGAELAAGQTPGASLAHAAGEWPYVAPAARAAAQGGDVPGTLRALAEQPGADALRVVAAAWQVAHRTGHGLADVMARVAGDLRGAEHTRRVVAGELASARATARLLAVLPVLALVLASGAGAGAGPWRFLLGRPVGLACLAAGLAFGYAGLAWVEALARDVDRGR